jgi:hypothetical protein
MLLEETCRFTTKVWALGPISPGLESGQIKINPITDPEAQQGSKTGDRSKGKRRSGAMLHSGTRESPVRTCAPTKHQQDGIGSASCSCILLQRSPHEQVQT